MIHMRKDICEEVAGHYVYIIPATCSQIYHDDVWVGVNHSVHIRLVSRRNRHGTCVRTRKADRQSWCRVGKHTCTKAGDPWLDPPCMVRSTLQLPVAHFKLQSGHSVAVSSGCPPPFAIAQLRGCCKFLVPAHEFVGELKEPLFTLQSAGEWASLGKVPSAADRRGPGGDLQDNRDESGNTPSSRPGSTVEWWTCYQPVSCDTQQPGSTRTLDG